MKMNKWKRFLAVLLVICSLLPLMEAPVAWATDFGGTVFGADSTFFSSDITIGENGISVGGKEVFTSSGNAIDQAQATSTDTGTSALNFTAGMYTDRNLTTVDTMLTDTGATLTGWPMNGDRYLGIDLSDLDSSEKYQVVVEMAPIVYAVLNSAPTADRTNVTYTQNDPIVVNTTATYTPKTYSLKTLTYDIWSGTEELSIGLQMRYDNVLWNKRNGANLGDGINPLIKVTLQKKGGDGNYTNVKSYVLQQATASGSVTPTGAATSLHILGNSEYATSIMGRDDTMIVSVSRGISTYSEGYYNKKMTVEFVLPTATIDGQVYTMQYSEPKFVVSTGTPTATVTETEGTVTISMDSFYSSTGSMARLLLSAPKDYTVKGTHKFTGYVSVTLDDHIALYTNRAFSITLDTASEAKLYTYSFTGHANVIDLDVVQQMGNLSIGNAASFANGSGQLEMELEFDENNTKTVSVTTVNMVCDRDSEYITIYYTLVDAQGNPAYGGQTFTQTVKNTHYNPDSIDTNNKYQRFTRNNLTVEEHRQYYFKTFRYTIGNLDGNTQGYHSGAGGAPYSAGTFWGYVRTNTVPTVMPMHRLTVYDGTGENRKPIEGIVKTVNTILDAGMSVSYGISGATVSKDTVEAGNPVTIGGTVTIPEYPYSSNNILKGIRVGIILPAGVTVNQSSVSPAAHAVTYRPIEGSTDQFCIVEFDPDYEIGQYTESLGPIANGRTMQFSIQLNSDISMTTYTMNLRESVFVAGDGRINAAGGSYSDYSVADRYDLNENGSTTDAVGSYSAGTKKSVTFQSPPAVLNISDTLTKEDGSSGNDLTLNNFADQVNYQLKVECTAGGSATDFYYFIPVAKQNMAADGQIVVKNMVDLVLKDGVSVTTSDGGTKLVPYYTTEPISSYAEAVSRKDEDIWHTALPEGKTWEDVTMIKILAAEKDIINGSINTVSVPLGYDGSTTELQKAFEYQAGKKIQWKGCGYYKYILGIKEPAGTQATAGCTVTLVYTPEIPIEFELTAAKGTPVGQGASKTYSFELPKFELAQTYTITDIVPSAVTLVDGDFKFEDVDSATANTHFRISVAVTQIAEGTSVDKGSAVIQKDGTVVGTLDGRTAPKFTFTLENADALTDTVQERIVTLTLIGNNGVIIPVKITIRREMAAANATAPAIVAGRMYTPFGDTTTAISVSQNSAFTAQFITAGLNPAAYSDRKLHFDQPMVAGTTITMIDWTLAENEDAPSSLKYYYYTLNGSTKEIPLSSFSGMGGGTGYTEDNKEGNVKEQLLFIIQFPNSEPIRSNTMWMTKTFRQKDNAGTVTKEETETSTMLYFTTVGQRTFSISTDKTGVSMDEGFVLTYRTSCGVNDSRYEGRNLALVVRSAGEAFPVDAKLEVGGVPYGLNADGHFIIPLEAISLVQGAGGMSKTARFTSRLTTEAKLDIELWASATASASNPQKGDRVAETAVTVTAQKEPSLKVTGMSTRVIHLQDLTKPITVSYNSENSDTITLDVRKKIGADYTVQTSVLESVNGTSNHTQGAFGIKLKDGSATLVLSAQTAVGTYRVVFTAVKDGNIIEVPYNFIVTD